MIKELREQAVKEKSQTRKLQIAEVCPGSLIVTRMSLWLHSTTLSSNSSLKSYISPIRREFFSMQIVGKQRKYIKKKKH